MKTISLSRGLVALVDDSDYERVNAFKWYADRPPCARSFYAVKNDSCRGGALRSRTRMHNFILGLKYVDHKDGDGLNNQRHNLRPATRSQNAANTSRNRRNSSGYKGVVRTGRGKWMARITKNKQIKYLGSFETPQEAADCYYAAAVEIFGEFARR